MAKPDDLTGYAAQGYAAPSAPNPHLFSSAVHMAFCVGQWMATTGRPAPRAVRMSRGYSVRCNDMLIAWRLDGSCERIN